MGKPVADGGGAREKIAGAPPPQTPSAADGRIGRPSAEADNASETDERNRRQGPAPPSRRGRCAAAPHRPRNGAGADAADGRAPHTPGCGTGLADGHPKPATREQARRPRSVLARAAHRDGRGRRRCAPIRPSPLPSGSACPATAVEAISHPDPPDTKRGSLPPLEREAPAATAKLNTRPKGEAAPSARHGSATRAGQPWRPPASACKISAAHRDT